MMNRTRQAIFLASWVVLLAILPSTVQQVTAQSPGDEWTTSRNLSQSGGASAPFMAVDRSEVFHVFWWDEFAEAYYYTRSSGQQWSKPQSVNLPFEEGVPWLTIDGSDQLQMFWLDEEDEELGLLQSSVSVDAVTNPELWSVPVAMGAFPTALELAVDDQDRIHLVYAQAVEPAGVYHQSSDDGGISWSPRNPLYLSPYFRGLDSEDINLSLANSSSGIDRLIFAAWDLRPLKRVFMARSANGGQNWGLPEEIAGPESGSSIILPFNIEVSAQGDQVILAWQSGELSRCRQLYKWSDDRGQSWNTTQQMNELLPGTVSCPESNVFHGGPELTYMLTTIADQVYIWAWDGSRWSDPQLQRSLTGFDNPENLNKVVFRCRQYVRLEDDQLIVVGCDDIIGDFDDGDIWQTTRELGSVDDWFPPPSAWSRPFKVASGEERPSNLVSVGDAIGNIHTFWTQANEDDYFADEIYYAGLKEDRWSLLQPLLTFPDPIAGKFTAELSPAGLIYLIWGDTFGKILFSRAEVERADIGSAWSPPERIPGLQAKATTPSLAIGDNGELYLAYTVPVNEERGIYLVQSNDLGKSWSEPVLVFDGVSADWDVVGSVRSAALKDGRLHALFSQQTIIPEVGIKTEALFHSISEDDGQIFSEPTKMFEGEATWSQIIAAGSSYVHHLWHTKNGQVTTLEHAFSDDGGRTWSRPTTVSNDFGPVAVLGMEDGRVYATQLTESEINFWQWTDDGWIAEDGIDVSLGDDFEASDNLISMANSANGHQIVTVAVPTGATEDGQSIYELLVSTREIGSGDATITTTLQITTVAPVTSPTMVPTDEVTRTSTVTVTDTTNGAEISFTRDSDSSNSLIEMMLSLVPVGLIVAFVLVIGLVRSFWLRRS